MFEITYGWAVAWKAFLESPNIFPWSLVLSAALGLFAVWLDSTNPKGKPRSFLFVLFSVVAMPLAFVFLGFIAEMYLIFLIIAGLPAEITVVVIVGIAYAIYYNQRMLRNARDAEKRRLNRPATSETPSQETPPQGSGSA